MFKLTIRVRHTVHECRKLFPSVEAAEAHGQTLAYPFLGRVEIIVEEVRP